MKLFSLKFKLLSILTLIFSLNVYGSGLDVVKKYCPDESSLYHKKLVLALIRTKNRGEEFCQSREANFLLFSKCDLKDDNKCNDLIADFDEQWNKGRGNVIGN